ncbi:MAG: adenylate/guanylate cyclase domain-containing protein [Actinobacteria bacterium]|nr:adenylate/guanylate cyclase domain-containing protein [Actinomycetota bacterium]
MRPDLPSGTVTFLFTDIEGSTRLLRALGPDEYARALAEHRRALRETFAAHGGVEVDTQGDAFFVAFPTAPIAAAAAISAQNELATGPVRVRMGLHTGAPTTTGEGYVGIDVHRGARVAALAHGGQVVVSQATAALLDAEPLRDLGLHRLKDFEVATRLFQLGAGDFPPLRTPGSVDLPTPATRFLGRERELFEAVSLVLDRDPRVLTIVGPGGTGKTRFAIELARVLADEAEGATLFVPLAPIHESALVLPAIADRLGTPSPEPDGLAAAVGPRRTHLVLDNLEHLLPGAAHPIYELVAAAPSLRLLVTSREPLHIQGEVELDLPPLADDEAVTLFVERSRAVRPDAAATSAVGELCRRLDRLPLALELAAARTKLLSPEQLLERLGQRLDLLKGTRDADERHATLRATIAWSYDLLEPEEQELFARLSVFAAGCTLESAETVCDADLDTLASLLDKSLLRRRTGRLGEERFWMLETIREFAAERLDESGDAEDVRRRHTERMLALARSAHLSDDDDAPVEIAFGLAERDDFRAALDWSVHHDVELGLELAIALENLWTASAPEEGMRRLELLFDRARPISPDLRARALRVLGGASDLAGEREFAERRWEESLELYRTLGDERGMAMVEHRLAVSAWRREDWERMRRLTEDSVERSRGRFPFIDITGYWLLGQLRLVEGDVEGATELTRRSADMAGERGWSWWESGQLHELLMLALRRDDLDEAEREGKAALRMEREQENRLWALYTIAGLAQVALARGELERAGALWGAVETEAVRVPTWEAERERRAGVLPTEERPAFVAGRERGRQLDLWEAAAIALGEDDQTVP